MRSTKCPVVSRASADHDPFLALCVAFRCLARRFISLRRTFHRMFAIILACSDRSWGDLSAQRAFVALRDKCLKTRLRSAVLTGDAWLFGRAWLAWRKL